jgi:hypothetical protein
MVIRELLRYAAYRYNLLVLLELLLTQRVILFSILPATSSLFVSLCANRVAGERRQCVRCL